MSRSYLRGQHNAGLASAHHLRDQIDGQRTPRPMRMTVWTFAGVWLLALGTAAGVLALIYGLGGVL